MMPYVLKEMLHHLVIRLVLTATLVGLLRKESQTEYNVILIKQNERVILISAILLGIIFGAIAIWLVFIIKGDENALTVIAGVLLSLGLIQQITSIALDSVTISFSRFLSSWNSVINLLAKQKTSPEWRSIQDETEEIFIFPQIIHIIPSKLSNVELNVDNIIKYIDEQRWELAYPQATLYHDEKSLHSFSLYAIEFLRTRLHSYDRLSAIQQRTGAINPVVFVALGTLIWLLS